MKTARKSVKQKRFDAQAFYARLILKEYGAVQTREPTYSAAHKVTCGDEYDITTSYGPGYAHLVCQMDGALWLHIRLHFSDLSRSFGVHGKQNFTFDKDNTPEEVERSLRYSLKRIFESEHAKRITPEMLASHTRAELERKAQFAAMVAQFRVSGQLDQNECQEPSDE